jgi:hypothetical protein
VLGVRHQLLTSSITAVPIAAVLPEGAAAAAAAALAGYVDYCCCRCCGCAFDSPALGDTALLLRPRSAVHLAAIAAMLTLTFEGTAAAAAAALVYYVDCCYCRCCCCSFHIPGLGNTALLLLRLLLPRSASPDCCCFCAANFRRPGLSWASFCHGLPRQCCLLMRLQSSALQQAYSKRPEQMCTRERLSGYLADVLNSTAAGVAAAAVLQHACPTSWVVRTVVSLVSAAAKSAAATQLQCFQLLLPPQS